MKGLGFGIVGATSFPLGFGDEGRRRASSPPPSSKMKLFYKKKNKCEESGEGSAKMALIDFDLDLSTLKI